MVKYEKLVSEVPIRLDDNADLPDSIKGLYVEIIAAKVILLNRRIQTKAEKTCVLAEELGHYYTSSGDIVNQNILENRKQEIRARKWAYEKLVSPASIVQAHKAGIRNRYELAEYIGVTEDFLEEALRHYKEKYGPYAPVDKYTVCFEPLGILEMFKEEV